MGRFVWISIAALAVLLQSGCMTPASSKLEANTLPPTFYDDAWRLDRLQPESATGEGAIQTVRYSSNLDNEELLTRYSETLARPSNVISQSRQWGEEGAKQRYDGELEGAMVFNDVLWVTNRKCYIHMPDDYVGDELKYGWSIVTQPDRERGKDAAPPEWIEAAPLWWQRFKDRMPKHEAMSVVRFLENFILIDMLIPDSKEGEWRAPHEEANYVGISLVQAREDFYYQLLKRIAYSPQKDVLVFVHGFNVTFDQAMTRAVQMAADIPFNGVIIVYSWPSQGGIDQYGADGESIDESVAPFTEFLTELGEKLPQDVEINLLAHSMGNRLLTRSMERLPMQFEDPPRFKEVIYCAPDVEVAEFESLVQNSVYMCERATLYKNVKDAALIASTLKNLTNRAGANLGSVDVAGLDIIETANVDSSLMGHSYYSNNPAILRDLFAVLKEHQPASKREWLKEKSSPTTQSSQYAFERIPRTIDWKWDLDRIDADWEEYGQRNSQWMGQHLPPEDPKVVRQREEKEKEEQERAEREAEREEEARLEAEQEQQRAEQRQIDGEEGINYSEF